MLIILRFFRAIRMAVGLVAFVRFLVAVLRQCGWWGKAGRVQWRILRRVMIWPPISRVLSVQERLLRSVFVEQFRWTHGSETLGWCKIIKDNRVDLRLAPLRDKGTVG